MQFFATCAKGLEEVLEKELTTIFGDCPTKVSKGGVEWTGSLETAYRACLWSRLAQRVLMILGHVDARSAEEMYEGIRDYPWEKHFATRHTMAVDFIGTTDEIRHTHFGALKVKDAIVDRFMDVSNARPSVDRERPDIRVNAYMNQDVVQLGIDLSGFSLHERGYREDRVDAPLKETLAAGLLALCDWQEIMFAGGAFVDFMCGSGTIPIEAALMATDTAPGLGLAVHGSAKRFGFVAWKGHDSRLWEKLIEEAKERQRARLADKKIIPPIVGTDHDHRAVTKAIQNVERAGMRGIVHIEKRDLKDALAPKARSETGLVIVNPPYGERIGQTSDEALTPLYELIGDTLKQKFKGYKAGIFTGNLEVAKKIGLAAERRVPIYNGALDCRLLKYSMY